MGKFVIYARKSTESEDRQVLSIDSQVRELQQLADKHGVMVDEVLTESCSAKAPGRPVFGQLMHRVRSGAIRGVLCWKMDRLARNPYDSGLILQAQADGQLERIITSDGVKTTDGNDRLMGTFELAFATKFIDDLRANVKRGNRARFEKGWPNFRPPIGYLNDRAAKTVIKDEERFPLVRRIWDALLTGRRPKEITRAARDEWGLLTVRRRKMGGKPLSNSSVYNLLTNPYYAGFIRLKDGRRYIGAHVPMVTPEEFDRAQEILGLRGRAEYLRHRNPYASLIRCAHCGCSIIAEFHEKGGRTYTYHRCGRSKPGVPCREKPISQTALEQQLSAYFIRYLAMPEPILAFLRRKLDRFDSAETVAGAQIAEQHQVAVTHLERQERELLGMRMRELIGDAEFQREREALHLRRRDLERGRANVSSGQSSVDARKATVSKLLDIAHGLPLVLAKGDPVQVRGILQQLHLEMTLRARRLDVSTTKPLSLLINAGADSSWQATWIHIWKWVRYGDAPDSEMPSDDECRTIMTEQERAVQGGGVAGRRPSCGRDRRRGLGSLGASPNAP